MKSVTKKLVSGLAVVMILATLAVTPGSGQTVVSHQTSSTDSNSRDHREHSTGRGSRDHRQHSTDRRSRDHRDNSTDRSGRDHRGGGRDHHFLKKD